MSKTRSSSLTIATLSAGALAYGAEDDAPPARLVVLPWGRNPSRRGEFVVDELTAAVFEGNQKKHRIDGRVALDFEHNTLEGTPAYASSSEPRPIAAWALCRIIPNEGLVYEDIQWTPDGLSAWQRRLYQDLSPAPVRGKDGKTVIALHSTALCRHGELEGLTIAHAAAPKGLAAYFDALSADLTASPTLTTSPMKDKLIALLALLGVTLAADADEAATATALDAATEALKKLTEKPAEPAKAEGLSAELATLRLELDTSRKEMVVHKATLEGKVIPLSAEALKVTPLSVVEELAKNAKAGEVKLGKKTVNGQEPEVDTTPEPLSAETLALASQMGVSEADIRKFAPVEPTAAAA